MTDKAGAGFTDWLDRWWRNPSPIDPINRANVLDAYLAGWRDGRRDARDGAAVRGMEGR